MSRDAAMPLAGGSGEPSAEFTDVLALDELPEGGQRTVFLQGRRVLLCRNENVIRALEDLCPHALQPLKGGLIQDGVLQCPKHGARFDLNSGRPLNQLTTTPLRLFQVRVRGQRIEIAP